MIVVVSRGIREPSGVEGGAQQPHPAVREIPVRVCIIWVTSADWHVRNGSVLTGHHGTSGKDDRILQEEMTIVFMDL